MNQTEIYQNMTKGEWKQDGCQIHANGKYLLAASTGAPLSENEANAALIVLMKRETIDKGIHPESVGKMKTALNYAKIMIEEMKSGIHQTARTTESIQQMIEEALTAAKL